MALTEEEKNFARKQIKTYENIIKGFQETIKHLEDKIAGNYTLDRGAVTVGVTENISKYTGDKKEKRKPKQK